MKMVNSITKKAGPYHSSMYNVNGDTVLSYMYIQDLIPPLVSEISGYPLRNLDTF